MAEPKRNLAHVARCPEHHHCAAVAKLVRRNLTALQVRASFAGGSRILGDDVLKSVACHRPARGVDEEFRRLRCATYRKPGLEIARCLSPEREHPFTPPLANDVDARRRPERDTPKPAHPAMVNKTANKLQCLNDGIVYLSYPHFDQKPGPAERVPGAGPLAAAASMLRFAALASAVRARRCSIASRAWKVSRSVPAFCSAA